MTNAEPGMARDVSGLMIFLLTVAWIGGTIAFFAAAVAKSWCLECDISEHDRLVTDRLALGSVACACVLPVLAALICAFTGRRFGAVLFLVLGISVALAYGTTVGAGSVRDIHRVELRTSVPVPSNHCPCYSGGGCDCPGG